MKRQRIGAVLLAGVLAAAAAPVLAQDESPEPVETSALAAEHRDLFLDMPITMGGFEAEIVLVRGEEHFAQLPDNHPERVPLETLLVAAGAEVEDLTTGYALVSVDNLFSFVIGIRIDGAECFQCFFLGALVQIQLSLRYSICLFLGGNPGGSFGVQSVRFEVFQDFAGP
jgi:hypothetical protein